MPGFAYGEILATQHIDFKHRVVRIVISLFEEKRPFSLEIFRVVSKHLSVFATATNESDVKFDCSSRYAESECQGVSKSYVYLLQINISLRDVTPILQ